MPLMCMLVFRTFGAYRPNAVHIFGHIVMMVAEGVRHGACTFLQVLLLILPSPLISLYYNLLQNAFPETICAQFTRRCVICRG